MRSRIPRVSRCQCFCTGLHFFTPGWLPLAVVLLSLMARNEVFMVGGFGFSVVRCVFPFSLSATIPELATEPAAASSDNDNDNNSNDNRDNNSNNNNDSNNSSDGVGWIQRMNDYLLSEKDDIFRDQKVAVVVSSSPDRDRHKLASMISRIGSESDELYIVVSPQQEAEAETEGSNSDFGFLETSNSGSSSWSPDPQSEITEVVTVETIDFDDVVDTRTIGVIVLATDSMRVVQDDSFVNDFLRWTDAWIHMGSEFGDDFCYWARLQEGANITLW